MSLEKLVMEEFQGHESKTLEFHPQITTIVGDTDAGKSTCVRALAWVAFNHPATSYLRHGADTLFARLHLDGRRIERQKGSSNTYRIDKDKSLKAVGYGSVPEQVSNILNVQEWNIQWQGEPPFWFHLTPGQVSKELNQIVNLSVIDSSLYFIGSETRKAKAKLEVSEARYKELEEKRKSLLWVQDVEEDWEKLEEKKRKLVKLTKRQEDLKNLLTRLREARDRVKKLDKLKEGGEKVVEVGVRLQALTKRRELLGNLLTKLRALKKKLQPIPDISPLVMVRRDLDTFVERRRTLERLLKNLNELKEKKCQLKEELEKAKSTQQYTCPMCGQTLPS